MTRLGYAFLHQHLRLSAFEPKRPALLKPVSKLVENADHLAVPSAIVERMELDRGGLLAHLLFALKHEGTNLAILMEALSHLPEGELAAAIRQSPGSAFV